MIMLFITIIPCNAIFLLEIMSITGRLAEKLELFVDELGSGPNGSGSGVVDRQLAHLTTHYGDLVRLRRRALGLEDTVADAQGFALGDQAVTVEILVTWQASATVVYKLLADTQTADDVLKAIMRQAGARIQPVRIPGVEEASLVPVEVSAPTLEQRIAIPMPEGDTLPIGRRGLLPGRIRDLVAKGWRLDRELGTLTPPPQEEANAAENAATAE